MIMKGGWTPNPQGSPAIKWSFVGTHLLSDVLEYNFEIYQKWLEKGKKISSLGNFGTNESTTERQEDTTTIQRGKEISEGLSEDDIPF